MSSDNATTKPTIETVLERIAELKASLDEFRKEQQQVNLEQRAEMEKGFRRIEHKIEMQAKNLLDIYADHKELESRVDGLEKEPA